jgi:hypothetical protein
MTWVDLTTSPGDVRIFLNIPSIKVSGAKRTAAVIEWMPYGFVSQHLEVNCAGKQIQLRKSDKPLPEEETGLTSVDPTTIRRVCTGDFKGLRHMDHREFLQNRYYDPSLRLHDDRHTNREPK